MLAITDHSHITESKTPSIIYVFNNCLYLQDNCKETSWGDYNVAIF